MADEREQEFFDRADEFIHLANEQGEKIQRGQVSASFSYGAARYNVFVSACKASSAEHLKESKQMIIDYFTREYRLALEEKLDEYVRNFDSYFPRERNS